MIRVSVPATSANCCVGFDCMGLALNWRGVFEFEPAAQLKITGCPEQYCTEENLVVQAVDKLCAYAGRPRPNFHLHIDCTIPFARGLGSSSCCVIGGLLGADALLKTALSKEEILKLAVEMEGHPDNVAPALLGALTIAHNEELMQIQLPGWHGLVFVPDYEISTQAARKLLPKELPFKEAVAQTANALLFLTALERNNQPLAAASCQDYLHEPYRSQLIPQYGSLKKLCQQMQLPFWISGSGSCMIAISQNQADLVQLQQQVLAADPNLAMRFVEISEKGAEVVYE